jgi:hypothetical protein
LNRDAVCCSAARRQHFEERHHLAAAELLSDDDLLAAKVRLLDDAALAGYGLTLTDPIEQETEDLQDAKSWGLSRQEYMRRTSLAGRMCPSKYDFGKPDPDSQCYQTIMKTGQAPPNSVPQDEATFDRQMCINAGARGPDIEACVRASALYRRGVR